MSFKHRVFGFLFNRVSRKEISNNQISFILDDNNSFLSNFEYIKEEFKNHGDYEFFFFNKNKWSIDDLKRLSSSKFIFLNDNFLALAYMNFNPDTQIVQLWHAPGAFKKFGASSSDSISEINLIKKSNEKVTYLINTSNNISEFYAEAFQIDKSKIKPLGLPRMDYYFKNHENLRKNFDKKYPQARGKKIVLYAPTFRDNLTDNNIFEFFNLDEFNNELGDEYILAFRIHPKVKSTYGGDGFIDVSDFKNEQELLLLSDLLISDYSSLVIEYASLNKPIILFTYDIDRYLAKDRGFYFDLSKDGPGNLVKSTDELISLIKNNDYDVDNSQFLQTQFDAIDGKASKRIVELLLK